MSHYAGEYGNYEFYQMPMVMPEQPKSQTQKPSLNVFQIYNAAGYNASRNITLSPNVNGGPRSNMQNPNRIP